MIREIDRQEIALDIPLENGNVEQASTLFLPKRLGKASLRTVILLPEFGSNREQFEDCAEAIATITEGSSVCMAIDLLGHGESDGDMQILTIADQLKAARIAYDHLVEHYGDSERAGAIGASFGAFLAARLTEQRRLRSILLRAPAAYSDDLEEKTHRDYTLGAQQNNDVPPSREALKNFRSSYEDLIVSNNMRIIREFDGTITIVKSEHDNRITDEVIDIYNHAAKHPELIIMHGVGHMLETLEQQEQFINIAVNWASRL
jgi:esterase/lipase